MPTALITGGTRGLGRALAADLVRDGWSVVIDGRDADAVRATTRDLTADADPGAVVWGVVGDVSDEAHRAELAIAATALGRLDLLVNNASTLGPSPLPPLAAYPLDALERVYRVNVVAPVGLVQAVLPLLVASSGTIVNITSDAAVEPYAGWGGYGSSKAALEQATNVLAAEEPGLRVYSFDPGDMRTQMHQDAFPGEDISDRAEPETVVPSLRALLWNAPPSGRFRATDLVPRVGEEVAS